MKLKEIIKIAESDFPLTLAFDRDNVGLLVGDGESEVKKLLFTCDVDEGVVNEAVKIGADTIISHHPLMFFKVGRMTEENPEQRAIRLMIKNNINLYSAHTNLDAANGGINDYMASLLKMKDTTVVDVTAETDGIKHGFGRVGFLEKPLTLKELMNTVIKTFNADGLRYAGDENRLVKKLAVNTGGGADILYDCIDMGCDVLITGDIKYNGYRDAAERGMAVIDLMHFDSEKIVMDFYEKYFSERLTGVEFAKSKVNVNTVKTYVIKN